MDSGDVMFGIILLGFVLCGLTVRAEYWGLRRARAPEKKVIPLSASRRLEESAEQDSAPGADLGKRAAARDGAAARKDADSRPTPPQFALDTQYSVTATEGTSSLTHDANSGKLNLEALPTYPLPIRLNDARSEFDFQGGVPHPKAD